MLEIRSLSAGYGSFQALFDVSLKIEAVAALGRVEALRPRSYGDQQRVDVGTLHALHSDRQPVAHPRSSLPELAPRSNLAAAAARRC